jgi:predicted NBD/HSP70 family sugar kinase
MEQLRRHNLHLVLRAIYSGAAQSRAELAVATGLTKPTVSTLVGDLLADGFISERGPGRSSESGGKRPTLLQFEPLARQVIGISVVGRRVLGVLTDLAGEISALHVRELDEGEGALDDDASAVGDVVAGLLPQLDAPLLSVGAGLPGSSATRDLARRLAARFGVEVHLGNQAELSALGQLAYADGIAHGSTLVNLIVDRVIEIGVAMAGGLIHYGSDLGALSFGDGGGTLDRRLTWEAVGPRLEAVLGSGTQGTAPSYLRLRDAALRGDPRAAALMDELARDLAAVLAWLVATLRPRQVSLGGRLGDLGQPFLDTVRAHAEMLLPAEQLAGVDLSLAYTDQLGAMGAAALAIQAELELLLP